MDIQQSAASVREELHSDLYRGLTALAELAGRHANDRELVYRAVLLRRELAHHEGDPTIEQADAALGILEALVADQNVSPGSETRYDQAEAARSRALAMEIPSGVAVACEHLNKSYRRGSFALNDVSMAVRYGEILGVVGRNGNGKTTLFRLLVGELRPDAGRITFPAIRSNGKRVNWAKVRQQIAYVPQDLPPWYGSLRSNLHYEAAVHDIRGAHNEREVAFIIERLGLTDELDKGWHELSGGFKLRFALARALVWKPKLLILDEPLANLDFLTQQIVLNDLRHLTDSIRYPLAVMVSSQHLHEIEAVSDNLLLLTNGRVRFFGDVGDIGSDRDVNRYEIDGSVELDVLRQVFKGVEYLSVYYTGVAFVLTTEKTVTMTEVMRRLLEAKLPVTYFRDISRSAKSLLQDEAGAS